MTKTKDQTDSVERMLDDIDVNPADARDATHFRRIIAARQRLEAADDELHAAIATARNAGDSWTIIGAALDVSRQAAQQRFERGLSRRRVSTGPVEHVVREGSSGITFIEGTPVGEHVVRNDDGTLRSSSTHDSR